MAKEAVKIELPSGQRADAVSAGELEALIHSVEQSTGVSGWNFDSVDDAQPNVLYVSRLVNIQE